MKFYLQRRPNKYSRQTVIAFAFDNLIILYVMGSSLLESWVRLHPVSILNDTRKYKEIEESKALKNVTKHSSIELIFTSGLEP